MMIFGIGTDLVEIDRIDRCVEKWGDRFLKRVFCQQEIERCLCTVRPASCLAARFAAKEAFVKALGTGFRSGMGPGQICVVQDELGKPDFHLRGRVLQAVQELAITGWHLSLSHEKGHALAVVILMGKLNG